MSTYSYKFVFLGDPDVTVNQSRGINIQFNGYVPITCKNATYLSNLLTQKKQLDVKTASSNGDILMLFRDTKYIAKSDGTETKPDDSNYNTYIKTPGSHMFQGITAMGASELQFVDENGSQRSTMAIEFPLSDTMFGDRLTSGKTRIDGVLLYGQAYNPMFNDEHRQGDLERSVPVALVVFAPTGSGDKPYIDPSNTAKVETVLRIGLNVISGDTTGAEVVDTPIFKDWQKLAGSMHVVNDGMATSADFIVRGHEIDIAHISDDFAVSGDKTIDVATRMFFSEDPEGTNTDLNVDFGSPARLNVMNYDEISEGKKPQMMISKVRNWTDTNGYKHASWDGVVESWYSESGEYNEDNNLLRSLVLGSVYDVDYVAKERPAVNIFSDRAGYTSSTNRKYAPCSPGAISEGTNLSPGMQERWDERTSFASAPALFSKNVRALNDTIVINSENVDAAGNFNIIGSIGVYVSSNPHKGNDQSTLYQYQGLIANSIDVQIEDCEEEPDHVPYTIGSGAYTHPGYFPLQCKTHGNNNVIGSRSVLISSRYPYYDYDGYSHPDGDRQERTFVANCDRVNMNMCDRVIALGLKGVLGNGKYGNPLKTQKRFYQGASKNTWWSTISSESEKTNGFTQDSNETEYPLHFNTFTRTEDSVFIGGSVNTTDIKGVVVIGTGCPRSDSYGANIVEGFRATDEVKPIGHAYMVEHSAIIGLDNRISTIFPEMADTKGWRTWCKGRVSNTFEMGKTLINDVRQQWWIEDQYANVSFLKADQADGNGKLGEKDPATLILGSRNAYYCQKGKWVKQIVIGGYSGKGVRGLGPNSSERYKPWWNYNGFEFKAEWESPSRNALAIQDMKGRQVMYTSLGVNLGFMKGKRDAEQYEKYRYSDMGNINFFKLYRLLKHLYYDFETGYVKFSMTPDAEDGKTPQDSIIYPVKFHTTAPGTGNDGKDTCLADLVDDRFCYFPNFPIGDPYSDGGGTYTTPAVGGGDTPTPTTDPTITGNLAFTYDNTSYNVRTRVFNNVHITDMISVNMSSDLIPNRDDQARSSRSAFHTPVYYTSGSITLLNNALSSTGWRVAKLSDMQSLISALTGQTISQTNRNISGDLKALYRSDWLQNPVPAPWVTQLDGYLPKDKTLFGEAVDLFNYCYVWCFDDNSNRMAIKFNGTSASLLVGDSEIPTGVAYYIALAKAQ